MQKIGVDDVDGAGIVYYPQFFHMCHAALNVDLIVSEIGASSLKLGDDIRRKRDGTFCFHADITTVLVNLDTLKPTRIDAELRGIFAKYLAG